MELKMYLQGNLQIVFDALYGMGVIEPVLKKDWKSETKDLPMYHDQLTQAVDIANRFQESSDYLAGQLQFFDQKTLEFLAMEVAKEYADFHSRDRVH